MTWTLNGKFLSQPVTGVQRYARQMVSALSQGPNSSEFELVAPVGAQQIPGLEGIAQRVVGRGKGHLWEQSYLPISAGEGLISLCNTGPVAVRNHIVCIHDANVWEYPASYSRTFRVVYRHLLPALGRSARKVITVSTASADALVKHGIARPNKIEVIPNGHEHIRAWNASRSVLLEGHSAPTRPFVFALGSRAPHKNLALLLSIAPQLDALGLDLYVSGGSFGIFADQEDCVLPSNVRILGFVQDDDLALLYQRALCLAFPSFVEGFGLPLVEAMAFGCPIICSDTSCMPEVCGDYASYATPTDGSAWVRAIKNLYKVDDRRREPPRRLEKYSWEMSASHLRTLIAEL